MKISVIIPVLNEVSALPDLLKELQSRSSGYIGEILVVDGGSTDGTQAVVKGELVRLIPSERGRPLQLNKGAQEAHYEILWFLHADSLPPVQFDRLIVEQVKKGNECGCFRMKFDSRHVLLRFFGWLTRFNSDLCRGGDQSLFVTKSLFERAGAFNEKYVIFEDNEIIPRLKKESAFAVIQKDIITSARRYKENGVFRLQFHFARLHMKYRRGVEIEELLRYYKAHVK